MVAPRRLIVEAAQGPQVEIAAGNGGGAPAEVVTPALAAVRREVERAQRLVSDLTDSAWLQLIESRATARDRS